MTSENQMEIFPDLDENLLKLKLFPIIIRPNLGQPEFINAKNFDIKDVSNKDLPEELNFEFKVTIAACEKTKLEDIFKEMDSRVFIYPLSETIIEGRAVRLNKIPVLIKEIKKVKITPLNDLNFNNEPQIYLKTEKIFQNREEFYEAKIIFKVPSEYFLKTLEISTEKITKSSLRNFILCDIVYDLTDENVFSVDSADDNYLKYYTKVAKDTPNKVMRINYHSLVLTLKSIEDYSNLKIWQASDLHVCSRADKIPHAIFKEINGSEYRLKDLEKGKKAVEIFNDYLMRTYVPDEILKSINERLQKKFNDKSVFAYTLVSDETPYEISPGELPYSDDNYFWQLPIEYRAQNCNNNLRMFIYQANETYKRGDLDLIVFSGDLIDFVTPRTAKSYEFKYSNWKVFMDIILGKPNKVEFGGILPAEEILLPIYTIPGNHDYRGHSYPPTFGHEMLGFNGEEIKFYPSSKLQYLKSLIANIKYLRGYFQFINPDLNYVKKFGKTHFFFLDTDKDSMADLYDLFNGSPSTKGFRTEQIEWMRNYCDKNVKDDESVIIFTHAPPLNPPKIELVKEFIEKLFPEMKELQEKTGTKKISIDLLKEYTLIDKMDDPRIDQLVNLKFGTIVQNWEEMLNFCLNCKRQGISKRVKLVSSGHAHKNIEFRIQPLHGRDIATIRNADFGPLKKINVPCAVYMGDYSNEYEAEIKYLDTLISEEKEQRLADHNLITNQYPFITVITALGPRSQREYSNLQAFREIILNENRLDSFKSQILLRYFIPFALVCEENEKKEITNPQP